MRYPRRMICGGLAVLCLLAVPAMHAVHADPADFQAMPGLWRIVVRAVNHGQAGTPQVKWRCLYEGGDPWATFVDPLTPAGARCHRESAGQRGRTFLSWTLTCRGAPSMRGTGRLDFDSAEHYTGHVELAGRGEVLRVEGTRRAACTAPSD